MILWLLTAFCGLGLYATKDVLRSLLGNWLAPSPLRNLKGPNNGTLILGHTRGFKGISNRPERWIMKVFEKFGPVTVVRGPLNSSILSTTDLKATEHIFNNINIYQKSPQMNFEFGMFVGEGIFTVDGDDHRRQRRTINFAFGPRSIRNMCDLFLSKSMDFKDELDKLFDVQNNRAGPDHTATKSDWVEVEMLSWLSRIGLDMVGLAGFDHSIDSLTGEDGGLYPALADVFSDSTMDARLLILKAWLPLLRLWTFDRTSRRTQRLHQMLKKLAKDVVARKKSLITDSSYETHSRDLLTLLIKANDEESNPNRRMSEEEVLSQVPSFLIGAHEGVAAALVWTLFSLCNDPAIQSRLRAELQTLSNNPTVDELNSLTYLDHVLRESLRYHTISAAYERIAVVDDVIPCETPYEDRDGNVRTEIVIAKGDTVRVPIFVLNRLEGLWGPDANEFNPDRWDNLPKPTEGIPAIWGNQATFLAGPRFCPGYRFALLEMKALLFVLVKTYEFELAVPREDVLRLPLLVAFPIIRGEIPCSLPMRIKKIT